MFSKKLSARPSLITKHRFSVKSFLGPITSEQTNYFSHMFHFIEIMLQEAQTSHKYMFLN